jgi:ZIP family zinc transporter
VDWPLIITGFGASIAAGLATGVGALPVMVVRRISGALQDAFLGFSVGVMLAASFFSLIIPGINYAEADLGSRAAASLVIAVAVLLGAALLAVLNRHIPHEHFLFGHSHGRRQATALNRTWLFVLAITLHNFPEGLAVGVGFGTGNMEDATTLAIGISLQNMPEGLAVATAWSLSNIESPLLC